MSAAIEQRNQDATCYCGNLDESVTEELLWELMIQAGPVINVHMPRDKVSNSHQGYGFVEFRSEEDAEYAIKVLNMIKLFGKPLRVNKASQDRKAQDVGANLFIGQLDPEVDEKLLYDTFSAFGFITITPKVMRDPDTGASKGYGFVSYDSFEASDLAIECMNGQHLCNRQIVVQYAFKKDSHGERHGSIAERLLAANNPLRFKPHTMFASEQGQIPEIQQQIVPNIVGTTALFQQTNPLLHNPSFPAFPPPPPPGSFPPQMPQYLSMPQSIMAQGGLYGMHAAPPPPPQLPTFNGLPLPPRPPNEHYSSGSTGDSSQISFRPPSPPKNAAIPLQHKNSGALDETVAQQQHPIMVPPPPPPSFMPPPPPRGTTNTNSDNPVIQSQMFPNVGIHLNGLHMPNIPHESSNSNSGAPSNIEISPNMPVLPPPLPPSHTPTEHMQPQSIMSQPEKMQFQGQGDFSMSALPRFPMDLQSPQTSTDGNFPPMMQPPLPPMFQPPGTQYPPASRAPFSPNQ